MSDELQEAVAVIGHDWATFCVCLLCSIGFLLGFIKGYICISHWGFPLFWIVLGSTLIIVCTCRCVLILSLICVCCVFVLDIRLACTENLIIHLLMHDSKQVTC